MHSFPQSLRIFLGMMKKKELNIQMLYVFYLIGNCVRRQEKILHLFSDPRLSFLEWILMLLQVLKAQQTCSKDTAISMRMVFPILLELIN
ncbi:hypothetical protein BMF92_24735 [Serratia sp. OLBL1]|nr:hypothetical protein BMF92_24735 [Serratia sp. OLBL1]PII65843.1 hypothetical protein BMH23_24585 [Serratia sp. OLIL2]